MKVGDPDRRYWFPAKRYGWGWGSPVTRQGWAVLIVWVIALAVGASLIVPNRHPALYAVFIIVMVGALTAVCYAKGEPPRWRWGDRDDRPR